MRYLVIDTETTGLDSNTNRIVEFAAVPMQGLIPTMDYNHQYFNPEMEMPLEAFHIHGLSTNFLKNYPIFKEKAKELREYLEEATLIIHNARFDMAFLNAEFARCNLPSLTNTVIDTLQLARSKFPGKRASLDALCNRFNISLTERAAKGHGALLDAQLLTKVYLKLVTQNDSFLSDTTNTQQTDVKFESSIPITLSEKETQAKTAFLNSLQKK